MTQACATCKNSGNQLAEVENGYLYAPRFDGPANILVRFDFDVERSPQGLCLSDQICVGCRRTLFDKGILREHVAQPGEQDYDDGDDRDHIITCGCCSTPFKGFTYDQAYGCATEVYEGYLHGHFGSAVADMTTFRFPGGAIPAPMKIGDIVCDECIKQMIRDKAVVEEIPLPAGEPPQPPLVPLHGAFVEMSDDEIEKLFDEL